MKKQKEFFETFNWLKCRSLVFNFHQEYFLSIFPRDITTTRTASGKTFSLVQYTLTFQRKGNFIFFIIFLPGVIINVLCCSTFFLPCTSGEKIGFTVTLFLAQSVNLMIFTEFLPQGGNKIPLAAQYSIISSVLTSFSVLYGIWSIRSDPKCQRNKEATRENGKDYVLENFSTRDAKMKEEEDFAVVREIAENELTVNRRVHGKDGYDLSILDDNKGHRLKAWGERPNVIHPNVQGNNFKAGYESPFCVQIQSEIIGMLFNLIMLISTLVYSALLLR